MSRPIGSLLTPTQAAHTFLGAAQRQDRQTYDFAHNGDQIWSQFFASCAQKDELGRPIIVNFEIATVTENEKTAQVTTQLSIAGKTTPATLTLEKRAVGWVVIGAKDSTTLD